MALNGYTNYLALGLQDAIFGQTTYVAPSYFYVALSTTEPNEDGSNFTEPGPGIGYARRSTTKENWRLAALSANTALIKNLDDITFETSTGGWGLIVAVGIYDSQSGATNLLFGGNLTSSKQIDPQTSAVFLTDDLALSLSNQPT